MGDMGDIWRETKEARSEVSRNKKEHNKKCSTELLKSNDFNIQSKNGGTHLVVSINDTTADFWPTTGKWNVRGEARYFRGVKRLISRLRKEK